MKLKIKGCVILDFNLLISAIMLGIGVSMDAYAKGSAQARFRLNICVLPESGLAAFRH